MSQPVEPLPARIFTIRGHRVILDTDLARLYGVATKRFNEAFKRTRQRFPVDFAFQLTRIHHNFFSGPDNFGRFRQNAR